MCKNLKVMLNGVCIVRGQGMTQCPQKVKISTVKHRFGCRLGLCTKTHIVTFTFAKIKGQNSPQPLAWKSCRAAMDPDRLMKHCRSSEVLKISLTKRQGGKHHLYLPAADFMRQLVI